MTNIISMLYAIGGVVMILGYYPTIKDLRNKLHANPQTYFIWGAVSFISVMYGTFVMKDWLYTSFMVIHTIICMAISFWSARLRA